MGQIIPTHSIMDYIDTAQKTPALVWGFVILFAVGFVGLWWVKPEAGRLAASYLGITALLICFIALTGYGFRDRYLIALIPIYYLLLTLGLWTARRIWWPLAVVAFFPFGVVSVSALGQYYFDPDVARPGYRAATSYIEVFGQPGDAVLPLDGIGPQSPFPRYYRSPFPVYNEMVFAHQEPGGVVAEKLSRLMPLHRRWWVLKQGFSYADFLLTTQYYLVDCHDFSTIILCLYSAPEDIDSQPRQRPVSSRSIGEVELAAYQLSPNPCSVGGTVSLKLFWYVRQMMSRDGKVSVRLVDDQGHRLLQTDRPPLGGFAPTSHWEAGEEMADRYGLLLPPDILPGLYSIEVILYDPVSGEELSQAVLAPLEVVR